MKALYCLLLLVDAAEAEPDVAAVIDAIVFAVYLFASTSVRTTCSVVVCCFAMVQRL